MKNFFKCLLFFFALISTLFVMVDIFNSSQGDKAVAKTTGNNITESTLSQTNSSTIEVTPDKLSKDYKDNAISANQKYKNKKLKLNATIADFDTDVLDRPYLALEVNDESEFDQPWAYITNSEISKVVKMKKGQDITLICTGNGNAVGIIYLKDCVIQ